MQNKFLILILFVLSVNCAVALDFDGDFSQRSVLMRSIYGETKANQEQRDLLTSKGLSPNVKCLIDEIKKGNYENVKILLDANLDPNVSYMSDYPVYIASKYNKFEIVKLLVEHNAKLDRGFYSELYEAVKNKNKEMAQFLLDNGAKINYRDAVTNNTVLYMSLKNNMHDISAQLIQKGAWADSKSVMYIKKHKLQSLIPNE